MKKRSLVLVTVDCLRADHVGFQDYHLPVTPFLDSLRGSSVVFSQAIAAGVPTYFSFPAILASRYPLALGRDILGIGPEEPTIASALRDSGYKTSAFLAANPYLAPRFGYHQGFDQFTDFLDFKSSKTSVDPTALGTKSASSLNRYVQAASRRTSLTAAAYDELYFWYCQWRSLRENVTIDTLRPYPAADVMVDRACSWLNTFTDEKFFLWIHLMDPHYPHYPPQAALTALGLSQVTARRVRFLNSYWNRREIAGGRLKQYRTEILSLYDAGVFWVDQQLSRLASYLQRSNRWDETVFVVTADHGEEFLEHGGRYHSPMSLSEHLIHVPLLVRAPEVAGVGKVDDPFSLIHLAPTLLDAVGAEIPASFQGRSCWKQILGGESLPDGHAIAESVGSGDNPLRRDDLLQPRAMAIRNGQFKLVVRFGQNTDDLYDLKNDPEELSPLPRDVHTSERVRLLQVAREHLHKSSSTRNGNLALRARVRDLRHSMT